MSRVKIAGMGKTEATRFVAPRTYQDGHKAVTGDKVYEILLWSLNHREDRDWYPQADPDAFVVRVFDSQWVKSEKAWFLVYGEEETHWSYLKGFNTSPLNRLSAAARHEVSDQIVAVMRRGSHVHHEGISFAEILRDWVAEQGLTPEQVPLYDIKDVLGGARIQEPLGESWRSYHAKRATLTVVSIEQHRELHKRRSLWERFLLSIQ